MGYVSKLGLAVTLPTGVTRKDVEKIINLESFFSESAEWNTETFRGVSCWRKMYSDNEEYQKVKTFLHWLADKIDETEDGGYHWIKIGEDYDDFEENSYGDPEEYIEYERNLF